ncbi:nitrogenase molybdenum-iron protein subunit beta [Candidatus Poribacteria bacterium]|nr:nitrogenase molybdenum-iron protein subunit beta [Candidatus Poribacteria bacterium]
MLNATPKEIKSRKALRINPARTCQPIGAMYASLGIYRCMPHSHGSQGCVSYHRMHLARHFRDPIIASTSSFTEGSSVFGGNANMEQAVKNIFHIYNPDIIAIHTTCLSETIGDDIPSIIKNIKHLIPDGKYVIHANTPSYAGSHVTGYANMVSGMIKYLAETGDANFKNHINVIPGFMEPGDMREIKRIVSLFNMPFNFFPDTTNVVDAPITGSGELYSSGGAKISTIKVSGSAKATISLGVFSSLPAGFELNVKCGVEVLEQDIPIGIDATDRFIMKLLALNGQKIPPSELVEERGRLVDLMTDTYFQYHGKRAAIFGDPDIVIPMVEFVLSLGMKPVYCLTAAGGDRFIREIKRKCAGKVSELKVESTGDLFLLHQWIKNEKVDLIIGNTYGKYISKAENIPLVRLGFPVLDRIAYPYFSNVGYTGTMRLIEKISTALLDKQDETATDEQFELVM